MFATSAACKHYLSLFIALTCIQHAAGKQRYSFRQGELVVPTTLAVEIEYEGRHGAMWKWFELCRVEKVEEGRLLVSTDSGLLRGWVGSIHVVPLKGAEAFFTKQCGEETARADGHVLRGLVHLRFDNLDSGERDLRRACEIDPTLAAPHAALGVLKRGLGEYDVAFQEFGKAIRLDPTLALGYFGRAQCQIKLSNSEAAIRDLTTAIGLEPAGGFLYFTRARIFRSLGDKARAGADRETGIRLAPATWWACLDRGEILSERGEWARARSLNSTQRAS